MKAIPKLAAATAVIALALAAAVASGAIPSGSDGVIHACYQKPGLLANPGAVRVIDEEAGQSCRSNETPIQWNRQGPKGDAGQPGPAGPSDLYSTRAAQGIDLPADRAFHDVVALTLPAGHYELTATATARDRRLPSALQCVLRLDGVDLDMFQRAILPENGSERVALTGVGSLDRPGTASVACRGIDDEALILLSEQRIFAIKVGALHEQTWGD
jgi:hypothetical protein